MGRVCKMWKWESMGEGVYKTQDGLLSLLDDGLSAITYVAERAWKDWMWRDESRVRRDEDYETRCAGREPLVDAHKEWNHEERRMEGVANERAGWMYARCGNWTGMEHSLCRCQQAKPDRSHWAWECEVTCGPAGRRAVPAGEGERRLCVPLVERPDRGWQERSWGEIAGLRQEVQKEIRVTGRAVVGTDGGAAGKVADERVAAYGVAVAKKQYYGEVGGMDQTAYMAELWALYKVLRSLRQLTGEIWIIIDNWAVCGEARLWQGVGRVKLGNCPRIWAKVQTMIEEMPGLNFGWVPSHGKKQDTWEAPEGHETEEWRRLNEMADEAAGWARDGRWVREAERRNARALAKRRARAALERLWKGAEALRADYPEEDYFDDAGDRYGRGGGCKRGR
jgi:hypothetical protein